jgi:hypothetical protein
MLFEKCIHQIDKLLLALLLEHVLGDLDNLVFVKPILDLLRHNLCVLLVVLVVNECVHTFLIGLLDSCMFLLADPVDEHATLLAARFQRCG